MKLRAVFGLLGLVAAVLPAQNVRMEARIYIESQEQAVARLGDLFGELDICTVDRTATGREFLVINTDTDQLAAIRAAGMDVEVTWADIRDKFRKMTGVDPENIDAGRDFGYFFTYWEMIDTLRRLAALYPQIVDTFKLGPTFQNRVLWGLRISDNPTVDEPEPEIFINGATHAREPLGTHACISFASLLCQNYGTDSLVTWLVRNREFYIIPVMNPDGYVYNSDSGGASSNWRKNRRGPVSPYVGIDLNRNYGYKWGYDNYGSSPTPSNETYRGPSRFSEPETRLVRNFTYAHKFRTCQDFHTYGRYNLCAWGYINPMPPDSLVLKEMCDTFRANNGYTQTGPIYRTIYPTNGGSTDYAQADTLKDSTTERKFITYGFSSELGRTDFWYGWNLPAYVDSEITRNIPNLYYLARVSGVFFDPRRAAVNDSVYGNRTNQLDPNETADLWFRVRNRAIHPLDSAYSVNGRLKSLDTMVVVLDSIKSFPLCRRMDSTDNRAAQFRVYCRPGAAPGRVVPLRLELTYRDDTLTMMQPVSFTITIGANPIYHHDVGCTRILAPGAAVDSGASVVPACSVYNYGDIAESYNVRMRIGAYNRTAVVTNHAAGSRLYVTFPTWTAGVRGVYAVSCSTELATDTTAGNNKLSGSVTVDVRDVACVRILAPADSVDSGVSITPACSVRNYGSLVGSYDVLILIDRAYAQTVSVASHAPGTTICVTFPAWTASPPGTLAVSCSTELAMDQVGANDRKTGSVRVKSVGGGPPPPPPGGWTARTPMPAGAKPVKDGGWLTYDASKARVYATRGQKQPDFYAYAPQGDSWGIRAPWLPGTEGKLPQKGSDGCADGNGNIYATKGNNTSGFYLYNANTNTWTQKKDVPLGLSNKKVKGGTGLAYGFKGSVGSPYLLKGYKNEFYKYNVAGDSWTALAPAPGAIPKWDKGSWLAYDDVNKKIYAFKAKYMELYSYNTENDSWSAALTPMPIPGSTGNKKAKAGGSGAYIGGSIYAFKGGNTQQFWKYTIATNAWAEKETLPRGTLKKKVNAGGDIVTAGLTLYALKGNKTNELWMYTPGAFLLVPQPEREGVLASGSFIHQPSAFILSPNPLASGLATLSFTRPLDHLTTGPLRLAIYDAAGRCIGVWKPVLRNGAADLDLRHLPAGVYLVRIEADEFSATQKFVVQR